MFIKENCVKKSIKNHKEALSQLLLIAIQIVGDLTRYPGPNLCYLFDHYNM